jgi:hypothetical protein
MRGPAGPTPGNPGWPGLQAAITGTEIIGSEVTEQKKEPHRPAAGNYTETYVPDPEAELQLYSNGTQPGDVYGELRLWPNFGPVTLGSTPPRVSICRVGEEQTTVFSAVLANGWTSGGQTLDIGRGISLFFSLTGVPAEPGWYLVSVQVDGDWEPKPAAGLGTARLFVPYPAGGVLAGSATVGKSFKVEGTTLTLENVEFRPDATVVTYSADPMRIVDRMIADLKFGVPEMVLADGTRLTYLGVKVSTGNKMARWVMEFSPTPADAKGLKFRIQTMSIVGGAPPQEWTADVPLPTAETGR